MSDRLPFTQPDHELLEAVGVPDLGELLDPALAIFPNVDSDLGEIEAVGFDMDYTLAIYRKQPMEQLQYDLTVERLILKQGYPEAIRDLTYDPQFIVRGLTVDKRSGHLLKTDTHGRVGRCFHGSHVAGHKRGDQSRADLVPAVKLNVRGLNHCVAGFDQGHKALGLNHAQRFHCFRHSSFSKSWLRKQGTLPSVPG
jgi:hypothetical protein